MKRGVWQTDLSLKQAERTRRRVFDDVSGHRKVWAQRTIFLIFTFISIWIFLFLTDILSSRHQRDFIDSALGSQFSERVSDTSMSNVSDNVGDRIVQRMNGSPDPDQLSAPLPSDTCKGSAALPHAAIASEIQSSALRVYAILPEAPVEAYASLVRQCDEIDVLVPEWYEIDATGFRIARVEGDAEAQLVIDSTLSDRQFATELMPMVSLAATADLASFKLRMADRAWRAQFADDLKVIGAAQQARGICIRLGGLTAADSRLVSQFLREVRAALAQNALTTCLVTAAEDRLWAQPHVVDDVDLVVVSLFQDPWRGEIPGPLAPEQWFAETIEAVANAVPSEKLVVAIGNHVVDWVSGQPYPERISFAEAMTRAEAAGASVAATDRAMNSYSSFVDAAGLRHQMWMLDAASAHNSLLDLARLGISNVALSSLGEEDPGTWDVISEFREPTGQLRQRLQYVALPDYVAYRGEGSFYRQLQRPVFGTRSVSFDDVTGRILTMQYSTLPRPFVMERYGRTGVSQVALTFDDGPDPVATSRILDVLKDQGVPATFFVVGRRAMLTPELLRRMLDDGHAIGSHSFDHPHLAGLGRARSLYELNLVNKIVEGATGRGLRLFRPPYERGPGPLFGHDAAAYEIFSSEGYDVAGSDVVPPDWTGAKPQEIVDFAVRELAINRGGVVVLHDGRSVGMHTAEALPLLIRTLKSMGYEFVPLSALLGMSDDAVMPTTQGGRPLLHLVTFWVLGTSANLVAVFFWVVLLASLFRAVMFLVLAHLRRPKPVLPWFNLPSVTVVIPAYNEEIVILRSIETALACEYPGLKVIVVDDGSTDRTLDLALKNYGDYPNVKVLSQRNQGKWKALNAAYDVLDTEIAVCVDADTEIAPDAIYHLVQPFADRKVAAVAGTVLVGNKQNLITRLQALEYFTSQSIGRRALECINGIIVVPGALGAWRVEAVRDLGLYSNETLTEDTDLTIWMQRAGYTIAYAESALAHTEVPSSLKAFMRQRLRWSLGNLQALWKHSSAIGEKPGLKQFSMLDMLFFGYFVPIVAPLIDLAFVSFVMAGILASLNGTWSELPDLPKYAMLIYILIPMIDLIVALFAFRFDRRESLALLLVFPALNLYFRQILYISVYRALWAAISGKLANWNKLQRFGFSAKTGT